MLQSHLLAVQWKRKKEKTQQWRSFPRLDWKVQQVFFLLLLCTKILYYCFFGQRLVINRCSYMMERVPAAADHLKALGHLICQWKQFVAAQTEEKMCLSPTNRQYFLFQTKALCPFAPPTHCNLKENYIYFPSPSKLTVIVYSVAIKLGVHKLFLQHSPKFNGKPCDN